MHVIFLSYWMVVHQIVHCACHLDFDNCNNDKLYYTSSWKQSMDNVKNTELNYDTVGYGIGSIVFATWTSLARFVLVRLMGQWHYFSKRDRIIMSNTRLIVSNQYWNLQQGLSRLKMQNWCVVNKRKNSEWRSTKIHQSRNHSVPQVTIKISLNFGASNWMSTFNNKNFLYSSELFNHSLTAPCLSCLEIFSKDDGIVLISLF